MPITCGIDLNINNLKSEITSKLSGFVDISATLGTPAGLAAIQAQIGSTITSITGKLEALIPAIPTIPQSLREDLDALAALPAGGVAALAKIAQFAEDYAGITDLKGFADINLNDLASSVFSVSGTFDPCSALSNIPNIIKDPVTGALVKLPSIQPKLGATTPAEAEKTIEIVTNTVKAAFEDNQDKILSIAAKAEEQAKSIAGELQPELEKMGDALSESLNILQTNISASPEKRPIDVPITLSSGNTYTGTLPVNMQEWSAADANQYIKEISRLHGEGKVTNGALLRAAALNKFHAEKLRLFNVKRVEEYRAEHPEFDDPSSPLYHMMHGKIKLEEKPNVFNGKTDWLREL